MSAALRDFSENARVLLQTISTIAVKFRIQEGKEEGAEERRGGCLVKNLVSYLKIPRLFAT